MARDQAQGAAQAIAGQAPRAGPQMPQVALQQRWPPSHVAVPQRTPAPLVPPSEFGVHIG
jgi:hypothetical protein